MDYKNKYLKYKLKYIKLKGGDKEIYLRNLNGLFNEFDKYLSSTKTEINCINSDYNSISNNIDFNESLKQYSIELTKLISDYSPIGLNFLQKYDAYRLILEKLFSMYRKINNRFIFEIKKKESVELKRHSREDTCNKQININSFHNFANQNLVRFNMLLNEINKNLSKYNNPEFTELQNKVSEDLCKYKNTIISINNLIKVYDDEKNTERIDKMMYELICLQEDFNKLSNDLDFKKNFNLLIVKLISEYGKIISNEYNKSKSIETIKLNIEKLLNETATLYLEYNNIISAEFMDKFDKNLKDIIMEYNFIIDNEDYKNKLDIFLVFLEKMHKDLECIYNNYIGFIDNDIFNKKYNELLDKINLEIFDNKIYDSTNKKNDFIVLFLDNINIFIKKYQSKIKKHSKSEITRTNRLCTIPTEKNLFNYFIKNFVTSSITDSSLISKINEIQTYINS